MTPAQARTTLAIAHDAPIRPEVVSGAYARAVFKNHPDHGGDGTQLASLKLARDTLLSHRDIPACKMCGGSGKVRARFGAQTCTGCEGTGDRRP